MPITLPHPITALSEAEFHKLDYTVMKLAFDIHNQMGRFYDEQIYQNRLKRLCCDQRLNVESEFEIQLAHENYSKSLFVDLLINGCIYELKTIQSIQDHQRIQTLDYLFTSNTQHGKIINFRPSSVEHEFVSTTLTHSDRKQFQIHSSRWTDGAGKAGLLKTHILNLLHDWGTFLDTRLYTEALIHLLGGEERVVHSVEIKDQNQLLGCQKFNCLSESEFFVMTAVKDQTNRYEDHLNRFLSKTPFDTLYWINLNRSTVELATLEKKSFCS